MTGSPSDLFATSSPAFLFFGLACGQHDDVGLWVLQFNPKTGATCLAISYDGPHFFKVVPVTW